MNGGIDKRVLWVFPLMAALETGLLVRNLVVLDPPVSLIMALAQGLLVAGALGAWFHSRGRVVTVEGMGAAIFALLIYLAGLILLEQALTHQGLLSANLALLLVVGGAFIAPRLRFAVYALLLLLGWVIVMATHTGWDIPVVQQGLLVGLGLFIACVVNVLRDVDRRHLEAARDEALRTAMRDPLTRLWNRRGAHAVLPSMIGGARTVNSGIWCAFIDVRGLKTVNDTLGHEAGDDLLRAIGAVLLAREQDGLVPARWGGDEFCLFGGGPVPEPEALTIELRNRIEAEAQLTTVWDLSCGVAYEVMAGIEDLEALVAVADEDMYRRRGRQSR